MIAVPTYRFLSILLATALLFSCQNEISEIKAVTDPQNLPIQTSYGAEYVYSEKGKIRNILRAGQLDQYAGENGYLEAQGGLTFVFLDSLEKEEARLTAIRGVYYEKEKKMVVRDSVQLRNAQNEMLETQELIFLQDSGKIFTDKFVTIRTSDAVFQGHGLESNDSFTKYRILKPSGQYYLNENDTLKP
jgi:LPS export ABC transporter protein LptC